MVFKKAFSVITIGALFAGLLAGCGPKEEAGQVEKGKSSELIVWTDDPENIKPVLEKFEKENKVKVTLEDVETTKQQERLRLDGPAGKGADVVLMPHDRIGPAAIEGLIQPIEVKDEVNSIYTESSIDATKYEGKQYGIPQSTESLVLVYNKKLMPEPPKTFDDLYAISKEMTKQGKYGFLAKFDDYYSAHGLFKGYGAYVFGEKDGVTDSSDIGLNTPEAVEALTYIKKWYDEKLFPKGIIGKNGGQALDALFQEGKAAAVMTGPWNFKAIKDKGIDFAAVPIPTLPNGEDVKSFIGVKTWLVSSFAKDKTIAQKFVEYVGNEENARERYKTTGEIVPVKSVIENEMKEDKNAQAVAIQGSKGVPMPNIPEMAEVWIGMEKALQTSITGKQEPKAALDEGVKMIEAKIGSKNKK